MSRVAVLALLLAGCGSRAELPPPATARSWVPALPAPAAEPSGPQRPQLPPITTRTLDNGLTVQIVELPGVPLVFAALVGRAESGHDASPELDALLEQALGSGLPRDLDDLSGDEDLASASVHERGLAMVSRVPSDEVERALDAFRDVFAEGGLDDERIDRARGVLLAHTRFEEQQRARRRTPAPDEELLTRLYGEGHPQVMRARLRAARLQSLPADDVRARLSRLLTPARAGLVVVGDVDAAALMSSVEARFAPVPRREPPAPSAREAPTFPTPEVRLRIYGTGEDPNASIRLLERGPPREHADHSAFGVFARLAGGMFGSRLNMELREQRGDTYGVVGRVVDRVDHSLLEIRLMVPVRSVGDAASLIVRELERLSDASQIDAEELELARVGELSRIAASFESATGLGRNLAWAFLTEQTSEQLVARYDVVEAVDAAAVAAAARRWIRADHAPMTVIGQYTWIFSHPIRVPGGVAFIED